jgi:RNA polymerase sigma-70 factor (ECF subfamily)
MATIGLLSEDGLGYRNSWVSNYVGALGHPGTGPAVQDEPARGISDDADWISRIQQGDEEAARDLFRRLYPTVISIVRGHRPKRTLEEDLTQAVFAKIFAKLGQFSGLVPLEHWVSRIAVNTCINQLKHEKVRPELRMSDLSEEQEAVVQQLAVSEGDLPDCQSTGAKELVAELLSRLRPEERLVLTLLHLEERSAEEISRRTGWSISCVKVRAFRARAKMRTLWDSLYPTGAW